MCLYDSTICVVSFIFAYNIDNPLLALLSEGTWVILQLLTHNNQLSANWKLNLILGSVGILLGWMFRIAQSRYGPLPHKIALHDIECILFSVVLVFFTQGYTDCIESSTASNAFFPLGRIRTLLLLVIAISFIAVYERKWHKRTTLEQLDQKLKSTQHHYNDQTATFVKRMTYKYTMQRALLIFIIACDIILFFVLLNRAMFVLYGLLLLCGQLMLCFIFKKCITHKLTSDKRAHGA